QIEERRLEQPRGMGRIWRIAPDGAPKAKLQLTFAKASSAELVASLGHPNGWVRDTAQRLLVERRDPAAIEMLRKPAPQKISGAMYFAPVFKLDPLARLHRLWTLDGLGALDRETLLDALDDADAR